MQLYLLGDGGRILAEELCDILKGLSLGNGIGDVLSVLKGQVFLVARYKF